MAEEYNNTLSFLDPTEPLGPITGSTNLPSTDPINMQPFEGDKFIEPEINFPSPVFNRQPAVDPTISTKENVVGKPGQPAKADNPNAKINVKEILEALSTQTVARGNAISANANAYSKPYSYDASPHGNAFYDRYHAYGQETFDKIGFSPLLDNESIYNANTSGWDDFSRMMTHSFWPLFSTGFVAGPKSLYKALQGDFGSDTDDAEIYERAAAIGQSSKEGFGSFMSNAFMNFGYTAGIVTESILEMGAAALLTAPTGGSSLVAEGALLGNKVKMLGQGLSGLSKLKNATTANQFRKSLQSLKSADNARKFYNFTKAEKIFNSPLGKFLNPLSNTTETFFDIAKNSKNLTGLAKGKQMFGSFYQDIVTINAALSESRLEGGMVENSVYRELYNDFYKENGFAPDNDKQKEFRLKAKDAGIAALTFNMPIILGTNKLVFDNVFGGKGGLNRLFGNKMKEVLDLKTGKIIKTYTKKTVGKKTLKVPTAEYVQNNLKNTIKNFAKQPLRKSAVGAITYFKANVLEGLQENAQEAIAMGTEKYYIESFKNPALATSEFAKAVAMEGIESQFTKQGFETFASGFVMGAFAGPLNRAPVLGSMAYKRFSDPAAYQKYKDLRTNYGNRLADRMNAVDIKDFWESRIFNYGSQATISNEIKKQTGEETESILKENAFVDGVTTALEHDTMDIYYEQMNAYKDLTQEEFEEAMNLEPGEGANHLQKIETAIDNAKSIESKWKEAKERFPDPIDFTKTSSYDKDSSEYEKSILLENAWKIARRNYVFFNQAFENTRKEMINIIDSVTSIPEIKDLNAQDVRVLFEDNLLLNQINILETEVESLEGLDKIPDKKDYEFKKKQITALRDLQSSIASFKNVKKNKSEVKAQIKIQLGLTETEYTEEELEEAAEEIYKMNKSFISPASIELEKAFKSYVQMLADKSETYTFDENLDKAFKNFSKYFELSKESRDLAEGINILHDPNEYMEHVERNMEWMKALYENRRSYYTEMVRKGFEDVEDNEILNWLASQNIYVSIDQFENWKNNGEIPVEFYDDTKKAVIREGHHQYNDYAVIFYRAQLVRSKKEDVVDKVYQDKIDTLIKQRDAEINALDKVEKRIDKDKIEPKRLSKTFNINRVDQKSFPEQYIELTIERKDGDEVITLYKDKEGNLRYDDENGELFDMKSKEKFKSGQTYVKDFVPDPVKAEEITKEYAERLSKLKAEAKAEERKAGIVSKVITKDTPISDMPTELAVAIQDAYLNEQIRLGLPAEQEPTDEQIISFIKTNRVAADLINNYNAQQELKNAVSDPTYDPELIVKGETKKASDFTEAELIKMKRTLTGKLKVAEEKKDKTNEDIVEINRMQSTINSIDAYLKNLDLSQMTPEQKKTVSILEALLAKQKEEIKTPKETGISAYMVDDVILQRVTNATKDIKYQKYDYKFMADAISIYNDTVKNNKATEEEIANMVSQFKKKRPQGFSEASFVGLETYLNKRKDNLTVEILEVAINEFQNKETRDAGDYIDVAIRTIFAGGEVKFDPKKITEEAYEELFGEEGSITNIVKQVKDNGLVIISDELILYDKEAKVAGTADLVAVDRTGKVFIIDIKTGKKDKWSEFSTHPSREAYTLQQAAYRNLLYNMTGITSSISVFPIEVNDVVKDGKITKGTLPKYSGLLIPGTNRIKLNVTDSFHKDGPLKGQTVQELIETIIPLKEKPGQPLSADQPTMQVGKQLSDAMMNKLNRIGLEEPVVKLMTDEEIDFVRTTLDETELSNFANSMIEKYGGVVADEKVFEPGEQLSLDFDSEVVKEVESSKNEIDEIINSRIEKYGIPTYDLFEGMSDSNFRVINRAMESLPVDIFALREAIDYLYNVYNEASKIKKDSALRMENNLTIAYIEAVQEQLEKDLNYLIDYETAYKAGETLPTFKYSAESAASEVETPTEEGSPKRDAETSSRKEKQVKEKVTKAPVSKENQSGTETKKADIERKTKEELFPIDSLHKGKESGDTLKVIGYTKDGVRFQIQTEGTLKPTKNLIFSELKRLIKEGKLTSDVYAELKALEETTTPLPTEEQLVEEEVKGTLSFRPTLKPTAEETTKRFNDYISKIQGVTKLGDLETLSQEIKDNISEFSPEQVAQLREAYKLQKSKVEEVVKADDTNVNKGNEFIVQRIITKGNEMFAGVGETVKVIETNKNNVKLQNSEGETLSLTIQELNSFATFKTNMGKKAEQKVQKLDAQDKQSIDQTKDEVDNFLDTTDFKATDVDLTELTEDNTRNNILENLDC